MVDPLPAFFYAAPDGAVSALDLMQVENPGISNRQYMFLAEIVAHDCQQIDLAVDLPTRQNRVSRDHMLKTAAPNSSLIACGVSALYASQT